MKKRIYLFTMLFIAAFSFNRTAAQVAVVGSTGADNTYTTLKLAFDGINANADQTGNNIVITITTSTVETASAVLNQPAIASWASLTIYPTTTGLSITGNLGTPFN